jgi:hypothetical protein
MVLFENNATRRSMYLYLHLQKHAFENQLALQTKKHSKNKNK